MKKRVVIIGSGLAGTLLANNLCDDYDVIVLEKGAKESISFPDINFVSKHFGQVKTVCHGGGGTTNLWHNGLIPMQLRDLGATGFKSVLADSHRFISKAASQLYFPDADYAYVHEKILREKQSLVKDVAVFDGGVDCLLHPHIYTKLSLKNSVTPYYSVKNISFESDNNKIKKVKFATEKNNCDISADYVIVSCGALFTPEIVSGIYKSLGLMKTGSIGSGLIDHPMGFVGKIKVKKKFSQIFDNTAITTYRGYDCLTAARVKCRDYTAVAFFRPALTMGNRLDIYKYKSRLGASSGLDRIKAAFSPKILHPDVLAEIYMHLFHKNINRNIYNVLIFFEQKKSVWSVAYREGKSFIDWGVTDKELEIYNETIDILKTKLKEISEEVVIESPISKDWLWSGAHYSGTIAMNDPDGEAFVDSDLKLNGCENGYVCDGSVIQEHSYTNTGLTIGSIALRLAERLRTL